MSAKMRCGRLRCCGLFVESVTLVSVVDFEGGVDTEGSKKKLPEPRRTAFKQGFSNEIIFIK